MRTFPRLRLVVAISLAQLSIVSLCQSKRDPKPEPHELCGFLLRQHRAAIEAALGKPFNQQKDESGQIHYAYRLPQSKVDYFVATYGKQDAAIEMELTGTESIGPNGFEGLQLGDSAQKVEATLGKPSEIRHEEDVDVDLWDYQDRNYSIEFTAAHKLYSFQIVEESKQVPDTVPELSDVRALANAIRAHNVDRLMEMASGEIECSTNEAFGIHDGPARGILSDPKSPISKCLNNAAEAISALGPETKGAEGSLRLWPEVKRVGYVIKFPANCPLREIVFVGEANSWRVYEVTFRMNSDKHREVVGASWLQVEIYDSAAASQSPFDPQPKATPR